MSKIQIVEFYPNMPTIVYVPFFLVFDGTTVHFPEDRFVRAFSWNSNSHIVMRSHMRTWNLRVQRIQLWLTDPDHSPQTRPDFFSDSWQWHLISLEKANRYLNLIQFNQDQLALAKIMDLADE